MKLLHAAALAAALTLAMAAPAAAQKPVAQPGTTVPSSAIAYGTLGSAATNVDEAHGLPVNCITGCASGGGGGGAGTEFNEDAAHVSGALGTLSLGVRKDAATALAGTDGDYSVLETDASGRLHVNVGTSALPTGAATSANQSTGNTTLSAIDGHVDGLEGQLTTIDGHVDGLEASAAAIDSDQGATNDSACATDNGTCSELALLKRANQRITSLIAALGTPAQATGATIQTVAGATGGAAPVSKQVANNTTSVAICTGPCTLYGVAFANNSTTKAYVKLFNAAQGSVTCGSGTPADRLIIPDSADGAGNNVAMAGGVGVAYGTALTACTTTGFADSDTTAPAANTYLETFYVKQ